MTVREFLLAGLAVWLIAVYVVVGFFGVIWVAKSIGDVVGGIALVTFVLPIAMLWTYAMEASRRGK